MADQRVLAINWPNAEWLPSNWSPSGEYIYSCWPIPFDLLDGANVEIRINMIAWCAGLTPPLDPRIRFRLGGTSMHPLGSALFVNEATHGALIAEYNVSTAYYAGAFWSAPAPEFNQNNAKRFGGVYTVAKPSGSEFFRVSAFADATDRGCGIAAMRVDFRGVL